MIIRRRAYPRAGLIGNPSDGYFGKTIAFTFSNFCAEVVLYETPELEILPNTRDHSLFRNIGHLADDVRRYGYYGGIRLLKATVKRFNDYASRNGIELHDRNFTIRYSSDIPHMVGLAGSSAIITACLRALTAFYGIAVPDPEQANLILSVEQEELGISAGLQDRVAQVYQGLVYMDFSRDLIEGRGYGEYEYLDAALLPPLYVAFRRDLAEGSETVHNTLRARFDRADPDVLGAIADWISLTDRFKALLLDGKRDELGELINANFDRRRQVCRISEENLGMIKAARACGASAKFTGSGGAIVGMYADDAMFAALERSLEPMGVSVLKPRLAPPSEVSGDDS